MRGEVRIFHDSGDEEALRRLTTLFLRGGAGEKAYAIEWIRMQKRTPILKLEGIEDRAAAEALVDAEAYALLSESRPDEDGAWLVSDLIGLEIFVLGDESAAIGRLMGFIDNPAHDILEIETEGRALMLPFVDTFVSEVDTAGGRIVIDPPEGWLEP